MCLRTTLYGRLEEKICSPIDSPSVHWMQTMGEQHIPVSSAPIKHSLMLAGTKCTLNTVTVEMFSLSACITTPVHPTAGQFSDIFQNKLLQFFVPNFTARRAARHQIEHPIAIGLMLLIQKKNIMFERIHPVVY